jgi:hypothetical protein
MDGFGRSLDRGYEANIKTATIHTAGSLVGARRRGGLQQHGIFSFWMRIGSTVNERIPVRWCQCSVVLRQGSLNQGAEDVPGELCRRALRTCPGSTADAGGAEPSPVVGSVWWRRPLLLHYAVGSAIDTRTDRLTATWCGRPSAAHVRAC